MSRFAPLPTPPYYAVTFASQRQGSDHGDDQGYDEMAARMAALAEKQPGFLGVESARDATGFGITVSYWQTGAAIAAWKQVSEHMLAQKLGKTRWYKHYSLRVSHVERSYEGPSEG